MLRGRFLVLLEASLLEAKGVVRRMRVVIWALAGFGVECTFGARRCVREVAAARSLAAMFAAHAGGLHLLVGTSTGTFQNIWKPSETCRWKNSIA